MLDQFPGIILIICFKQYLIINYLGNGCIQNCYLYTQYTYNLYFIYLNFNILS